MNEYVIRYSVDNERFVAAVDANKASAAVVELQQQVREECGNCVFRVEDIVKL